MRACRTPCGERGGSKAQGGGVSPTLGAKRKGRSAAEVCTSAAGVPGGRSLPVGVASAEDWGDPLRRAWGSAPSCLSSLFVRVSAHHFSIRRCGQERDCYKTRLRVQKAQEGPGFSSQAEARRLPSLYFHLTGGLEWLSAASALALNLEHNRATALVTRTSSDLVRNLSDSEAQALYCPLKHEDRCMTSTPSPLLRLPNSHLLRSVSKLRPHKKEAYAE
jgi:hypothetical protein